MSPKSIAITAIIAFLTYAVIRKTTALRSMVFDPASEGK